MKKLRETRGFTLVEVLIVVVIITILATLVLPRMLAQTERAKAAEAFAMVGAIRRAAENHFDLTGSYDNGSAVMLLEGASFPNPPGSWSLLGIQNPASKIWNLEYQGWTHSYMITAYKSASFGAPNQFDLILYNPLVENGHVLESSTSKI